MSSECGHVMVNVRAQSGRGGSAFTLVELLVAVAIIGCLSGLLMTGLHGVRARAWGVRCQNNLRQLGIAAYAYSSDAGRLPTFLDWLYDRTPDDKGKLPPGQLFDYVRSQAVYVCPSQRSVRLTQLESPEPPFEHSYRMNCMMCHAHDVSTCLAPARTAFFLEQTNRALPGALLGFVDVGNPAVELTWPTFAHGQRSTVLKVDGHWESLRAKRYRVEL